MNILHIEDDICKHYNICKVIERGVGAALRIDCVGNLVEGLEKIEESIEQGNPYDVIITDMWYPKKAGGKEEESGEELIRVAKEKSWNIPIILCSSLNYHFPEILGSVHYSKKEDWESKIVDLIKRISKNSKKVQ